MCFVDNSMFYKKVGILKILNGTKKAIQTESKIKDVNAFNWRNYAKKILPEIYDQREHETFYLFIFDFSLAIDKAYEKKDYKLAVQNLEQAYKINPSDINILNNIGIVFLESGDKENAKKVFEQILILDPNNDNVKQTLDSL